MLLLLFAQQSALSHASWHAGVNALLKNADGRAQLTGAGQQSPLAKDSLCAFDMAFGQVLGGTHGACAPAAFAPAVVERILDLSAPRLHAATLTPKSRGPPVLY